MTKIKHLLLTILVVVGILTGCTSNFDEINTNPNTPTTVTSSMLATRVILNHVVPSGMWNSESLSKRLIAGEGVNNYQYNRLEKGSFGMLSWITNAQKMVELSSDNEKDAYTGLYYYMKGWAFYRTTLDMGDIPYSQAFDIDAFPYPKYDEQKEVFKGILDDLKTAESYFAKASVAFGGDPFYQGDPALWRKATNVLRLKVLLSLQKRVSDAAEMQIKESFSQIVNEGNIFNSNEDNLKVTFANKSGEENPMHVSLWRAMETYSGSQTIIDPLKQFNDYRLFYYFAPIQSLTDPLYLPEGETLLERNDWNAYVGLNPTAPVSEINQKVSTKMYNRCNDIYRNSFVGVPVIRLGYADMNFMLAEAAERGWINAGGKGYYEEAIRASFDFVRTTVPNEDIYTQGMEITDAYIDEYLKGEGVAYKTNGNTNERLEQIWLQSYLASFFHLQWDSYYDYRRTGNPKLPINPATNLNTDKDKIPMRWLYPQEEIDYNKEQMEIALERQWNGSDDTNNLMWILK